MWILKPAHGVGGNKIKVVKDLNYEKNSLVHEIFHLCVWLSTANGEGMCLEKSEDEELVVNSLTNHFMTMLKQNKWLREYLLQD